MTQLLTKDTKVIVQGITGNQGLFHAQQMRDYGTKVVGGTSPGKGGTTVDSFPVFDSVQEAVDQAGAEATVIFVPAPFAKEAVFEAIDAGLKLIIVITEGIAVVDTMAFVDRARKKGDVTIIGPNCPGIITPSEAKMGIIPVSIVKKGTIGVVSRSGTLTYEVIDNLTKAGFGQSQVFGIGGDPYKMFNFIDAIKIFNADPNTKEIVMIGEVGGADEEKTAQYIKENVKKPVVGFIAGKTAKEGKTMGHAGAIVEGNVGTAMGKVKALEAAGVKVASKISEIPKFIDELK